MTRYLDRVLTPEAEAEKEWVAGIPRSVLFDGAYWKGFKNVPEKEMYELISCNLEFRPRTETLEHDESFKQITEYFLVRRDGKYFSSIRKTKGGDVRLHGARLIGFGGHLRKGDIEGPMKEWLKREFDEEINAEVVKEVTFIGIVNDDEDPRGVSQVHFGFVFVVDVEGNVSVNEKDKFEEGEFMTVEKLKSFSGEMESWSQLVVEELE